tara:strand:- start:146 stop:886 length:741 start_codon:yes stop_codon:yes gene_type:complete
MMKKKMMMAGGGMMKKGYKSGGKLKMVEKDGKMVPFYAADGKGKMAAGGTVEKRGKKKDDKKKAAKGDRGFQGRAAARDLAKFKEKRGRIGGASRGATGGAMGGGGGMGIRLMDAIGAPRPRRMKEGGMAKKGYAGGGMMKKGYAGGGMTGSITAKMMEKMKESGKAMREAKKTKEEAKRRVEDFKQTRKTGRATPKQATPMKAGGMAKKGYASGGMMKKGYASGGRVSARGDGIARKGKTRGRIV